MLRITTPDGTVEISRDDAVTIGRDEACDVVLSHPSASRRHALLLLTEAGWKLINTSSTGIQHDGLPVTDLELPNGRTRVEMPRGGVPVEIVVVPGGKGSLPESVPPDHSDAAPSSIGSLTRVSDLLTERTISIGRDTTNNITLDDLTVSREHAQLRLVPGQAELIDLGSYNGTFVNGVRIRRSAVADGDIIGIGTRTLRLNKDRLEEYEDRGAAWLIAESVSAVRGRTTILSDISLAIEPSMLIAIVGPSGAGKTTLLHALSGTSSPTSGRIAYGGRQLLGAEEEWRLRLGFVPQEDLIHTQLTVRQALEYAAELRFPPDVPRRVRRARIDEVMLELGIAHRHNLQVARLSGGQRKRTSIAVELLTKPSLLFLDEPTSGLDPGNEEHVTRILRDLAREGRIVVVTTHALASLDLCDRVLFLAVGGHVAFYGPPADARKYFAEHDLGDTYPRVFRSLDERSDVDWARSFRSTAAHADYVERPLSRVPRQADASVVTQGRRRPSLARQTAILVRRQLAIVASERRSAILLVAQAPIFALLFLLLFPKNVMTTAEGVNVALFVWLMAVAVTWLGTSNAIREIVKERAIVLREANVGVSMTAYYLSKAGVLGLITAVQAAAFGILALGPQVLPPISTVAGVSVAATGLVAAQRTEVIVGLVIAGAAAMSVGLLVSAYVRSSDQAMLLLPIILVAHVVVSAPTFGSVSLPISLAGLASSANWATNVVAATVDLNQIREPFLVTLSQQANSAEQTPPAADAPRADPVAEGHRDFWEHTTGAWAASMAFLIGIIALASFATWRELNRNAASRAGPRQA
ncbi:MAG: transport system ATP-binding/permease protein [Chloroflexota bacterium]|jgi:ABC-type multidrug transport system ATPase subunit/pSer/pThr/pTyr-binding forkhead associated (FHA) protein|nr:transport system ATP-binding/permease protein [Chloroflexota bacterium]